MLKGVLLTIALLVIAPKARADAIEAPASSEEASEALASGDEDPGLSASSESTAGAPFADEPEPPAAILEAPSAAPPAPISPSLGPRVRAPRAGPRAPPFTGDHLRYGKLWLIPRGILSGLAIPASVGTWTPKDVARFAAVTLTVTSLMLPTEPSADVRIQQWMRNADTPGLDRLFPKIYTIPMTVGLGAYTVALSAGFFFFKRPKLREYVSLMLEALGITQFYHVALKLMIGREGPYHGSREGRVHGPTELSFPGGTPSGHAASAFAVLVTAAEYYGKWPLKVVCYLASIYMATSFWYNHQHFLSDVIWGAAIGDSVAKWVVRHRASDARPSNDRTKLLVSPMAFPGGGGLRFSLSGGSFM